MSIADCPNFPQCGHRAMSECDADMLGERSSHPAIAQPVQPAADIAAELEISDAVVARMAKILAEIAITVNGSELPLQRHSYHDLADKVAALQLEVELHRHQVAQPVQPTALRGTDAQILIEREITANAIQGAMAYGYQNGEYPPDDAAWLRPFWEIGRRDAEREELISAQPVQPPSWGEAQRVCDLPAVDEAIRNLIEDNTGDNATCLVREIMNIAQPVQPEQEPVGEVDGTGMAVIWSNKPLNRAKLYTSPQRQPLTEFQRMQIIGQEFPLPLVQSIVIQKIDAVCQAIEAAHDIKDVK